MPPSVWLGQVMCQYDLYPINFLLLVTNTLLLSSSNDASVDIADDKGSFDFSLKAEFTSTLHVHITLARETEAASSRLAQLLQC